MAAPHPKKKYQKEKKKEKEKYGFDLFLIIYCHMIDLWKETGNNSLPQTDRQSTKLQQQQQPRQIFTL